MNIQAKAARVPSPHIRQRVAFIATLVADPGGANWCAISDTFDDLIQEVHGADLQGTLESLREPIRQEDAQALSATIGTLLSSHPPSGASS